MNSGDDARNAELLERYRQASNLDPRAPRDTVRAAILEEGRRAAEGYSQSSSLEQVRRRPPRWKMTAFATAATVLLAAVVTAPRLWEQGHGAESGGIASSFKQAAVRKAQPDAADYASTPPVNIVPVQPAPQSQRSNAARSNAAAYASARQLARQQGSSGGLLAAAAAGDSSKAAQLLDQAVLVDERDEAGRTPLMLAVAAGKLDVVRLLLAHGADPNALDHDGLTPLTQAQQKGYADIAAALASAGGR